MDSNHCMLESKSSALPLGDSPIIFLKTRTIIQNKFDFVNNFLKNFYLNVVHNQVLF